MMWDSVLKRESTLKRVFRVSFTLQPLSFSALDLDLGAPEIAIWFSSSSLLFLAAIHSATSTLERRRSTTTCRQNEALRHRLVYCISGRRFGLCAATAASSSSSSSLRAFRLQEPTGTTRLHSTQAADTDDFARFEASLEEEASATKGWSSNSKKNPSTARQSPSSFDSTKKSWQADLERLLDPKTPVAQRQILFSNLMNANEDIQASVQAALRDRKVSDL